MAAVALSCGLIKSALLYRQMIGRSRLRNPMQTESDCGCMQGQLYLWSGRALFFGTALDTALHQHHAVQLSIGLDQPFRLRCAGENWGEHRTVLIASDQPHQIDSFGAPVAALYLDPDSATGKRLSAGLGARPSGLLPLPTVARFAPRLRKLWSQAPSCREALNLTNCLIHNLTGFPQGGHPLNPHIARAFKILDALPEPRLPVGELAARVGLSAGRFAHLFREQTGLPVRRYLLWLRLLKAISQLSRKVSLTEAAHEAGFADSAHLTRTFRRMFGTTPSEIFRGSQFVQVMACPPLIE